MKLVERHWYLWQGTTNRTKRKWQNWVWLVKDGECESKIMQESQEGGTATHSIEYIVSRRCNKQQTDRQGSLGFPLHAICQSMNYSRRWWLWGCFSPIRAKSTIPFFFAEQQTAGCRPKLATESVKKRTALTLHWEGQPNHFVHPLLVGYTRPNMGQTKNCNSPERRCKI